MSRIFHCITFSLVLVATFVQGEDDFEKCVEIFKLENLEMKCCESMNQLSGVWDKCKSDSYDCKAAKCVLEKTGIMKDETINEDLAKSLLEKWTEDRPDDKAMSERVKQYCLDGQYEDYGVTDDTCPAIKFHICTYVNSIVVCSKWKDTDACRKVESLSKDCKKAMDEAK